VLTAGDHIRNLLGRYCERIDAGDFDGVGALFGETGVVADDRGRVLARGATGIAAFYASTTRRHADGTPRTKHLVVDTVLSVVGEDAIEARSSYVVLQADDGLPLQPIIAGRYVDTFVVSSSGTWSWKERRFFVDLLGDLSHHLDVDLGR
jgi:hypothetical protein